MAFLRHDGCQQQQTKNHTFVYLSHKLMANKRSKFLKFAFFCFSLINFVCKKNKSIFDKKK